MTATKSVLSVATHRIERVVKRGADNASASFEVLLPEKNGKRWIACVAGVAKWGTLITVEERHYSPECAAALNTAIQMAIDWIAEETV